MLSVQLLCPGMAGGDGEVDLTYAVIDRETGEAVGQVGTKGPVGGDGVVEIGYGMNEVVWGRGLGTEAVGALVDELLSRPGCRR
jgi:[ribosomal protein S5]-alanine N-acetyltransferase